MPPDRRGLIHEADYVPTPGSAFAWWLGCATALFTAWTGAVYFWHNRRAVQDDPA